MLKATIAHKVVKHIENLKRLESLKGQNEINHAPGEIRWKGRGSMVLSCMALLFAIIGEGG